jgi:hypothetical protein
MAKRTKAGGQGARSGPGWKFVDTTAFQGATKNAWDEYKTHWDTLIKTLVSEWNNKYPNGMDGKFIAFKTENDELKYLLKAKRTAQGSKGDDVFENPQ